MRKLVLGVLVMLCLGVASEARERTKVFHFTVVVDAPEQTPIPGATVELIGLDITFYGTCTTDGNGYCAIEYPAAAKMAEYTVSAAGYQSLTYAVMLTAKSKKDGGVIGLLPS